MTDICKENSKPRHAIHVYSELKRKLENIQIFLKICGFEGGRRGISFNVNRSSLDVLWNSRVIHTVKFPLDNSLVFVPTTCHGIQWVSPNVIHLKMQIKPQMANGKHECLHLQNGSPKKAKNGKKNHYHIRNGVNPGKVISSDSKQADVTPKADIDNKSKQEECNTLCFDCIRCGVNLLSPTKFDRVLDLPSDSWYAVADSIFCHKHHPDAKVENGDCKNGKIDSDPGLLMIPKEKDCFMGETHFLLNGTILLQSGMFYDMRSRDIKCSRCRSVIGQSANVERNGISHSNGSVNHSLKLSPVVKTVKIFKHCIRFSTEAKQQNGIVEPPQNGFINGVSKTRYLSAESDVAQLIEKQSKLFNGYRFVLESVCKGSLKSQLLVWVLETDVELFTAQTDDVSRVVKAGEMRVLKVMYRDCLRAEANSMTQQWQSDLTVHSIELPETGCLQILQVLMSSTHRMPESMRTANEFYIGYLRKDYFVDSRE